MNLFALRMSKINRNKCPILSCFWETRCKTGDNIVLLNEGLVLVKSVKAVIKTDIWEQFKYMFTLSPIIHIITTKT